MEECYSINKFSLQPYTPSLYVSTIKIYSHACFLFFAGPILTRSCNSLAVHFPPEEETLYVPPPSGAMM
jgi:hypothetical protein